MLSTSPQSLDFNVSGFYKYELKVFPIHESGYGEYVTLSISPILQ